MFLYKLQELLFSTKCPFERVVLPACLHFPLKGVRVTKADLSSSVAGERGKEPFHDNLELARGAIVPDVGCVSGAWHSSWENPNFVSMMKFFRQWVKLLLGVAAPEGMIKPWQSTPLRTETSGTGRHDPQPGLRAGEWGTWGGTWKDAWRCKGRTGLLDDTLYFLDTSKYLLQIQTGLSENGR